MSHPTKEAKHRDASALHRMAKAVDHISNVVTADLIVDFGVLVTGVILVILELGFVPHRPFDHDHQPQPVVLVREEGSTPSGGGH